MSWRNGARSGASEHHSHQKCLAVGVALGACAAMGHFSWAYLTAAVQPAAGAQAMAAEAAAKGEPAPPAELVGADASQFFKVDKRFQVRCIAVIPQPLIMGLALGDVDNDGQPDIAVGTGRDSRLYLLKFDPQGRNFKTELLGDRLAGADCADGTLANILIADVNGDKIPDLVAMTDQELEDSNMKFWLFSKIGGVWHKKSTMVHGMSHWTHGLAAYESSTDGMLDVFSVHCGHGDIRRYRFSRDLTEISYRTEKSMWAPGESLEIADVFNTGIRKLIAVQGDDVYNTAVKVYGITPAGLTKWPEACLDSYKEKRFCDATTCTGDVDNDGKNEMVVGWAYPRSGAEITLVVYKFDKSGELISEFPLIEFSGEYGQGYLEARMTIGKLGHDTKNKLYMSRAEKGVYEFEVGADGQKTIRRIVIPKAGAEMVGRIRLGDVDKDGRNELIFAGMPTVNGGRVESRVFLLKKVADD